jgi:hypothetical protein
MDILKPIKSIAGKVFGKGYIIDNYSIKLRLEHCLKCKELFKTTKQCKKCKCFVEQKTKFSNEKCPLLKWQAIACLLLALRTFCACASYFLSSNPVN